MKLVCGCGAASALAGAGRAASAGGRTGRSGTMGAGWSGTMPFTAASGRSRLGSPVASSGLGSSGCSTIS
ncbi:MAG TPA: hypothetical protein VF262_09435 [Burkholderiales bacterium]